MQNLSRREALRGKGVADILSGAALADRLGDLKRKLRVCSLACEGLEDQDASAIARMIDDIESEIEAIAEAVDPTPPLLNQVLDVRQRTERRVTEIIRDHASSAA